MPQSSTLSVGLDVHQESLAVAYIAQEHGAEGNSLGTIGTRQWDSDHLLRKMQSKATPLVCVYEAGPCGDWLSRSLTKQGQGCWVVAPSLIPKKAGDRVNTARRDAVPRARLRRAGALTPVSVPTVDDAAMRDLTRAREDAWRDLNAVKCRRKAFLLRHASRSTGRATGSPAPLRGLAEGVCPTPAQPLVFQAYVRAVTEPTDRLQRLAQELHEPGNTWRLPPGVEALQAVRGVPFTGAVTRVAARGDLTRVETPRQRMQFLGLTPSEDATGERRRQGSITTAGHRHARRVLVEGAWAYRYPANVSRHVQRRREQQPKAIQDLSWKAPVRLCKRYRRVMARGKHANQVVVAIARELVGFMWAMAPQVPLTP